MTDLFQYNPTPWDCARYGDNWDVTTLSDPDVNGVGVVATVFAGEDIARFLAAAPQIADVLGRLARRTLEYVGERPEDDLYLECDEEMRALAEEGLALLGRQEG
jgi:hypothetical protein